MNGMAKKQTEQSEKEPKELVTARIDPAVLGKLKDIAVRDERSISYLIEKAVREYVEKASR